MKFTIYKLFLFFAITLSGICLSVSILFGFA